MTDAIIKAVSLLKETESAIVILNDGKVRRSSERGIKYLLGLVENDDGILRGATVADKVVGRAAALLMAKGGVKEVYADVLSVPAQDVFLQCGIQIDYHTLVDGIVNRTGDGRCPMESAVLDVDNPDEAVDVLRAKLNEMSK